MGLKRFLGGLFGGGGGGQQVSQASTTTTATTQTSEQAVVINLGDIETTGKKVDELQQATAASFEAIRDIALEQTAIKRGLFEKELPEILTAGKKAVEIGAETEKKVEAKIGGLTQNLLLAGAGALALIFFMRIK